LHVEVNFGGLPFIADFVEQGGDQTQEGGFIGEEAGDAGAAFEFLVDAFQGVAGAQSGLVGDGQGEGGEALRQIGFQPDGEFGSAGSIEGYDFLKSPGIRNTFIHSLTVSAPASSRSEQPGPPLPDYDLFRKPPWAAAWPGRVFPPR
jgi:hypothetical protein